MSTAVDLVSPPRVRARTVRVGHGELTKRAIEEGRRLDPPVPDAWERRPATRGECEARGLGTPSSPCPFVSCRWHLYLDVTPSGNLKLNFPDRAPVVLPETCALDVAGRGGQVLEQVAAALNLTRERMRQMEERAAREMGRTSRARQLARDAGLRVRAPLPATAAPIDTPPAPRRRSLPVWQPPAHDRSQEVREALARLYARGELTPPKEEV